MKGFRKITSVLLALAMLLGISMTALAETSSAVSEFTIRKLSGDSHQYAVFQIFTGTYSDGKFSDIKYGQNTASGNTAGTAVPEDTLTKLTALENKSDREKLDSILPLVNLTGTPFASLAAGDTEVKVAPGYYLIQDTTALDNANDARNLYVVAVSENIEIKRKTDIPTVDKEIYDNADNGVAAGWGETADHNLNESFQFRLTATVPADAKIKDYKDAYQLTFHDVMSAGISFERIDSVEVNGVSIAASAYTTTATENMTAKEWTLTIPDARSYVNGGEQELKIVVTYSAHLNDSAVIGNHDDNKNTVDLEFSNNPNGEGKGKTKEDTVWAFSYELKNKKVRDTEDGAALQEAGFRLYKSYDASKEGDAQFADEVKLIRKDGAYKPAASGESGVEMRSGSDGTFNIQGLDAGTYYLRETTTPAGFNSLTAPITVVIRATHTEDSETTAHTDITITKDSAEVDEIVVVNKQGITLPSTGGMGTTVLYAAGALLVILAGAAVVVKRRREA